MYVFGDNLQPVGNVYGYPLVSSTYGTPPFIILHEDPGRLGFVRRVVSLFKGDTGTIVIDRVRVQWNREAGFEIISRTTSPTLVCPSLSISSKYNLLSGRTADSDEWLEHGDQFEITLYPQEGVLPYGAFTLVFSPEGVEVPLSITRTVPFSIQLVMNLG